MGTNSGVAARLGDARVVLVVACAVLVASISTFAVRTVVGASFAVAGTIFDARTGLPLKGAQVKAEDTKQQTNEAGVFRFQELRRGTTLRVAAANYHSASSVVSSDRMRIRLRPIPVTGSVKSVFTGKGIAADISGPQRYRTEKDGSFKVYGVGPGDTLKFTALGHEEASASIGPNRKVDVSLKLGRIDPNLVLRPVAGFGLVDAPGEFVDALRADLAYSDPEFARYVTGIAAKSVVKEGQSIGIAMVFAFDPKVAAFPMSRDAFFAGVSLGASSSETIKIRDTVAKKVRDPNGLLGYAWQQYAAFAFVMGEQPAAVESYVKALVLGETAST